MTDQERQNILDEEHPKLLRIGYIVAVVTDLFMALVPLIYVAIGITLAAASVPLSKQQWFSLRAPPQRYRVPINFVPPLN
jgi:hypothetical protein